MITNYFLAKRLMKRLWFRASIFAMLSASAALVSAFVSPAIPAEWVGTVGALSVADLLDILASSMLVVATFSLSSLLAVHASISSKTSPRAAQMLIDNLSAQNALATFVGGFLFALVGIITLKANLYDDGGKIILFATTIAMVIIIVLTFLRWIDLLSQLGKVSSAVDAVAEAADTVLMRHRDDPLWGGVDAGGKPAFEHEACAEEAGYVQLVNMCSLQEIAVRNEGRIFVHAMPGIFSDAVTPLATADFLMDEDTLKAIREAFTIGRHRTFEDDPRFGLIVLSEIASKALSPGVNDPGTAIIVMSSMVRLLSRWSEPPEEEPKVRYPNLYVEKISAQYLFEDAFIGISTYGAGSPEVGTRLQKALAALGKVKNPSVRAVARTQSTLALKRAQKALAIEEDYARLKRIFTYGGDA